MENKLRVKQAVKYSLFFGSIVCLVLISLSSLWLSKVIFNTERFTSITTAAFSEPSSRESVGNLVANRVFENNPILRATLSDRLAGYVAGLLGSEVASRSVNSFAREGQLLFTSPQRDPIVLDLSALKPIIANAQELVRRDEGARQINVVDIPDSVTIIDTSKLPNFHRSSLLVHFVGPFAFSLAIMMGVFWINRGGKQNAYKRTRIIMLVVLASSAMAVLIGPLVEPSFISIARDAYSQTLLGNIYQGFASPFRSQAIVLGGVMLFSLIIATVFNEFNKRYRLNIQVTKKY